MLALGRRSDQPEAERGTWSPTVPLKEESAHHSQWFASGTVDLAPHSVSQGCRKSVVGARLLLVYAGTMGGCVA